MKAIVNARIIASDRIVEGIHLCFDEKIVSLSDVALDEDVEIIDAKGAYVSPGFIDIHIHGSGGADVMDATPEALQTISSTLLQTGTTSFLATTMTMSKPVIDNALQNVKEHAETIDGAKILGVHLEGPFLNPEKHGAQDKQYICEPSLELIAPYLDQIRMITIAPEMPGAESFIRHLSEHHPRIVLSIGHSDATFEQSKESFGWGISHATHLFNAMNPYHHRKPGIVGAVFDSNVSCDIIADLVHTHPSVLKLVHRVKGERLVLITDAMRAGCMKNGIYDLGGRRVAVEEGKATLDDGTLAGSVLKMNDALKHMTEAAGMTLLEAVNAVTKIPAEKLGLKKGELKSGYDADMVIFDEDFSIITTIVNGEVKYKG
ncbi:N-acetylglucosamine-6-phosphate deacetylase [Sulfurovum lithotrophicum]|uniref:N-acetylglucosamine-6-phosphate deacetylase n=1 Tax=Sulfurovum lithotrophicum TaxID=206403 RepID=A0A7U4RPV5_9BACT|nr:N-acetylglucosamine-6-phosphate deacetylase [Sulfurovum lithotrophicum]AKF24036.1 N-acetylglucosamine-6-phosphate deacetylase [Sulfurovum lithotrophicum]